jgi:hypothetical protein
MEHIPQLTDHLVRELDRRQQGVRKKLLKRYDLTERELSTRQPNYKIAPEILEARKHGTITNIEEAGLLKTMYECILRCELDLTPKKRKEILNFCKAQIKVYDRLVIEREVIMQEAEKLNESAEETSRMTEPLLDIHANFANIKTLAAMKSYGFDDSNCVSMLGRIIGLAMIAHDGEPNGFIRPADDFQNTAEGRTKMLRKILDFSEKETAGVRDAWQQHKHFRWHGGPER